MQTTKAWKVQIFESFPFRNLQSTDLNKQTSTLANRTKITSNYGGGGETQGSLLHGVVFGELSMLPNSWSKQSL